MDDELLENSYPAASAVRQHVRVNTLESEPWMFDRVTISPDERSVAVRFLHAALAGAGEDELVVTASQPESGDWWRTAHTIIRGMH